MSSKNDKYMIMRQETILIVKDNYVGNVHITKTYIKAFNFRIFLDPGKFE